MTADDRPMSMKKVYALTLTASNTVTDTVTVSVTATVTDHDDHIATTIDTARFKCECCGKMYQLFIR